MVIIPAAHLRTQVERIFLGHGASESVAQRLADSLVESNLVGHDSHGVLRVPEYGERIRAGTLKLDGAIEVVRETAATALIDCGWNLGQVALPQGMESSLGTSRVTFVPKHVSLPKELCIKWATIGADFPPSYQTGIDCAGLHTQSCRYWLTKTASRPSLWRTGESAWRKQPTTRCGSVW